MAVANPSVRCFVRIPRDTAGHLDRTALAAAIDHEFRVVRWHPDVPMDRENTS